MNQLRLAVCLDVPQRALMLVINWGGAASWPCARERVIRIGRTSAPAQSGFFTLPAPGPVRALEGGA